MLSSVCSRECHSQHPEPQDNITSGIIVAKKLPFLAEVIRFF